MPLTVSRRRARPRGSDRSASSGPTLQDAAAAGRQAVRGLALPPGRSGASRTRAPTVPATGSRSVRTGVVEPAAVGHRQLDAGALADVEAGRADRPPDAEGEGPEPDHEHGDADEGGEADAQRVELQPAEQPADEHRARAEARRGPAGTGRHAAYLAVGTGTLARTSSTTPTRLTPRTPASSLRMRRWASTGSASALTSSGTT